MKIHNLFSEIKNNLFALSFKSIKGIFLMAAFLVMGAGLVMGQQVTPGGSLAYQYPIKTPTGTNGTGPELSLVYNSAGGNGMLGMGWSITGFPVISRDSRYGIDFDDSDHYIYNG